MPEALRSGKDRALRLIVGGAVCFALIEPACASECAPEPQGGGVVSSVIDARTLQLDDGRVVRLTGLASLQNSNAERAKAALATIAIGREVSLHGDGDAPDRYGRQRAWVFAAGDASALQTRLLAAGGGLRDSAIADADCRTALESAETAAREARLGLWSASKPVKNAESPDDISTEIGHFTLIEGRVRSVRLSGGWTYLNFGRRWIDGFAVLVSSRILPAFAAAGLPLQGLEGKRLRVRGYVMRRGGPRIEVSSPEQIEVVGGSTVATAGTRD